MIAIRSLRHQILLLAAGLTLLTTFVIVSVMLRNTGEAISESVNNDIGRAVLGFEDSVLLRSEQLLATAQTLVSDFGFKEAVASQDQLTIASMIENHSRRVGADLLFLVDLNGQIMASNTSELTVGKYFEYPSALATTLSGQITANFFVIEHNVYQMLLVPVKAPRLTGIAGIGFRMDGTITRELGNLSGVDITIIEERKVLQENANAQQWIYASSLAGAYDATLAITAPAEVDSLLRLPFTETLPYVSRSLPISETDDTVIKVVLTKSLIPYYENFNTLRNQLIQISSAILLLALIGSYLIARSLTVPLNRLVHSARSISAGEYQTLPKARQGSKEVRTLVNAFRSMNIDLAERERKIRYQATHDTLTGLLNRDCLYQYVDQFVGRSFPILLLGISLKDFKTINDSLGIDAGDLCLIEVAKRIKSISYEGVSARFSSAEFCFVLDAHNVSDDQDLMKIAHDVIEVLKEPMSVNDVTLSVDPRVSMVSYPLHAGNLDDLKRRISVSMEHVATLNQSAYIYQDGQDQVHLRKLRILKALKEALQADDNQLQMYYQPKLNLKTGKIEKVEALIRWFSPGEGLVSPELFISLAEQTGLINQVTEWVIRKVFEHHKIWQEAGLDIQISINVSAQDLSNELLRDLIDDKLAEHQLDAQMICLEITERDVMTNVDKALELLDYFRDKGFKLSIDDYGVGYSALSKLAMMPVGELKIDKCFIQSLASRTEDQVIVKSTVTMAHELGLIVIAEGVEDDASLQWLRDIGCDYVQGYLLARPMPFERISEWIDDYRNKNKIRSYG